MWSYVRVMIDDFGEMGEIFAVFMVIFSEGASGF